MTVLNKMVLDHSKFRIRISIGDISNSYCPVTSSLLITTSLEKISVLLDQWLRISKKDCAITLHH